MGSVVNVMKQSGFGFGAKKVLQRASVVPDDLDAAVEWLGGGAGSGDPASVERDGFGFSFHW